LTHSEHQAEIITEETINPDTGGDEFFRSRDDSQDVIVENCTVHDSNQGISLIGKGNYIIRDCHVYDQNGDGMKFQGDNILITGNTIHHIIPPLAWSVSKNPGPYNCSSGITLTFYVSESGGSFINVASDTFSGASMTSGEIASQLNANQNFIDAKLYADVSPDPYPYVGNVRIIHTEQTEASRKFYITGDTGNVFSFSDSDRDQNDISENTPAYSSIDHPDYIANDDRDANNIIIRNNTMYAGDSQGVKLGRVGNEYYEKKNIAFVNNLFTGTEDGQILVFFFYRSQQDYNLTFNNILVAYNTIIRPATGTSRASFNIDIDNPNITNLIVKNNIIGDYNTKDYPLESMNKGVMDYNLFNDDTYIYNVNSYNEHSFGGDPKFVDRDNWDFSLGQDTEAKGKADPSLKIKYDINWNIRNTETPAIGCYE